MGPLWGGARVGDRSRGAQRGESARRKRAAWWRGALVWGWMTRPSLSS